MFESLGLFISRSIVFIMYVLFTFLFIWEPMSQLQSAFISIGISPAVSFYVSIAAYLYLGIYLSKKMCTKNGRKVSMNSLSKAPQKIEDKMEQYSEEKGKKLADRILKK